MKLRIYLSSTDGKPKLLFYDYSCNFFFSSQSPRGTVKLNHCSFNFLLLKERMTEFAGDIFKYGSKCELITSNSQWVYSVPCFTNYLLKEFRGSKAFFAHIFFLPGFGFYSCVRFSSSKFN